MSSEPVFTKEQVCWVHTMDKYSKSRVSRIVRKMYVLRIFRGFCLWLVCRLEGGVFFSQTLREILEQHHGVKVGKYSYGSCLKPGILPRGTIVGSYCSFADGLKVFRRNHPIDVLSQHPFFYNRLLGLVQKDTINSNEENPLVIGNDVWVGDGVTILPSCKYIGNGAILGAGSVITKNIEPFTVVAGNPAKMIKRRFSEDEEVLIMQSQWWRLSLQELLMADKLLVSKVNRESLMVFLNEVGSIRR